MKSREELLKKYLEDFEKQAPDFETNEEREERAVQMFHLVMEEYSEQNVNQIYELLSKPRRELKPLEELYKKEHPREDGKFYIPDATQFYKWIRIKILGE